MRRNIWAGLIGAGSLCISLAGAGPALAADVAAPLLSKAPIASAPNWTGFYVGANVGYGIGRNPSTVGFSDSDAIESFTQTPAGMLGGFQAGYDLQSGPMVFGIEGDWQWSAQHIDSCLISCSAETAVTFNQRLQSFGTLRGRLGVSTGSSLLYATAGWAVANITNDVGVAGGFGSYANTTSFRHTASGWTAGGGIETAIGGNWTAKVEYLYADFGNVSDSIFTAPGGGFIPFTTVATSDLHEHIVRAGINYRFNGSVAPGTASATPWQALQAAPVTWTGVYVGGNLGYGIGQNRSALTQTNDPAFFIPEKFTMSPGGIVGGVQAGYNWQAGHIVTGVEADVQGGGQRDTACMQGCEKFFSVNIVERQSWFATVRGRIGYAAGSSLLYATGGYAVTDVKTDLQTNFSSKSGSASFNATRNGWTLGGGIETMIAPNWSTKVEYLYTDYGSISNSLVLTGPEYSILNSDLHDHVVRAGVNYHFGG